MTQTDKVNTNSGFVDSISGLRFNIDKLCNAFLSTQLFPNKSVKAFKIFYCDYYGTHPRRPPINRHIYSVHRLTKRYQHS